MSDRIKKITNLQSLDYIHDLTKELSLMGNDNGRYGFRVSGSSGEWNVSRRIEAEMKSIGLKDVTTEKFPVHSWEFLDGSLTIGDTVMPMSSYCGIKGTPEEGVTAEIVDIGRGTAEDYEGLDVTGKIVFCTFDILDDYWISLPVYQAERRGAKGCIISYAGDFYGTKEDAINCFDSQCRHSLPVGNISRKNAIILRDMLAKDPVTATMKLDIIADFEGNSSNVIGYIPGEDSEKMILLGGHMDGYFHSYQDDLLGVGIIMGIAKSMIDSGYKPKHTIAFIAHGSEEYGVTESRYDWCIGSWNSINRIHPDWPGKMLAFFNIDAIRPGTPVYNIASSPEYHGFFKEFMKGMDVPATSWKGGSALLGLNGPWSDDYNYSIKGVPGIICGRGPAEWSYQNYHTQFDSWEIFEEEKEIIQYVAANYTEMVLAFDDFLLPPMDFGCALEGMTERLDDAAEGLLADDVQTLKEAVGRVTEKSSELFAQLKAFNNKYLDEPLSDDLKAQIDGKRRDIMSIYKMIQGDLMKLSPWDDVVFAHAPVVGNISGIRSAINDMAFSDVTKAVNDMWEVDLFKIAYQFDSEVYRWLMDLQDPERTDLFWGTGKIHRFADLLPLADAMKARDEDTVCAELKNLLDSEQQLLKNILHQEIDTLAKIEDAIDAVQISRFI